MANITFNDLPTRTGINPNNDFFIINSSNRSVLPEGKVRFSTVEAALRRGLITTYYNFQGENNVTIKTSSTTTNTITINDEGRAVIFRDSFDKVFGSFQIECLRTGNVTLANVLCQYTLTWIPVSTTGGAPRLPQKLIEDAYLPINNSTAQTTASNFQNLQTNSFLPLGTGNFRLTVKFTQNSPTAKAKINYKLTLFQPEG
jgi:hypothetical protein